MDFQKHYFKEDLVDEGIGDVAGDIAAASTGTVAKAAAKGVGRGIANIARGLTGRTKKMAFEPNWLKVLKPVDQKNYQRLVNQYANWKSQKTKLGPKKNILIKDIRDGVLGDFSGDKFIDILDNWDSSIKNVDMDAKMPPQMTIYLDSLGGKTIFFNLPIGEDGKKRKFAMGIDNKAERAFRLINGKTFQDATLKGDEEEKAEKTTDKGGVAHKIEIDKQGYFDIAPEEDKILKLAASKDYSGFLKNILNEESMEDKMRAEFERQAKEKQEKKDGDKKVEKPSEEEKDAYGRLFYDIEDELKGPPNAIKPTDKVKNGWRYVLKNAGTIFVYQGKDDKYYIGFDDKGKVVVDKENLIDKYGLEKAEEVPE